MGIVDFVKEKIEDKKEENKEKHDLQKEAREEAKDELKEAYKEDIIAKEKKKLAKGSFIERMGKKFEGGEMFGSEKMDRLLGKKDGSEKSDMFDKDRIKKMLK